MTDVSQTAVTFGDGWELRIADLQDALSRHYDHQKMMVRVGARRKPDKNSDFISVAIRKDGKVVAGWRIKEVRSNLRNSIGATQVKIAFRNEGYRVLEYVAHTQELRVLMTPPPQPVYL